MSKGVEDETPSPARAGEWSVFLRNLSVVAAILAVLVTLGSDTILNRGADRYASKEQVQAVKDGVSAVDKRLDAVQAQIEKRIDRIEAQMATRESIEELRRLIDARLQNSERAHAPDPK